MNAKQAIRAIHGERALRNVEHIREEVRAMATLIGASARLAEHGEDSVLRDLLALAHAQADELADSLDWIVEGPQAA